MKLTFLGVGDAFAYEQNHTSAFLEFDETNLFIDFPATNRKALKKIGLDLNFVENVFITHLHEDHVNGIQQLAHFNKILNKKKPNLFISENLIDDFWDSVKVGLSVGQNSLEDYFNVHQTKEQFIIGNQVFDLIQTNHYSDMYSYGLLARGKFYYSGDGNVDESFLNHITKDNIIKKIFHDCHLWDLDINSHASLNDIKKLSQNVKDKIVIIHYHDGYAEEPIRKNFELRENLYLARELHSYLL